MVTGEGYIKYTLSNSQPDTFSRKPLPDASSEILQLCPGPLLHPTQSQSRNLCPLHRSPNPHSSPSVHPSPTLFPREPNHHYRDQASINLHQRPCHRHRLHHRKKRPGDNIPDRCLPRCRHRACRQSATYTTGAVWIEKLTGKRRNTTESQG